MNKIFFIIILFSFSTFAKNDSAKVFKIAIATELVVYSGTMYGLNKLWYSDYERSSFHFHNDNNSWFKLDKFGHATTAYNVSLLGKNIMKWSGVPKNKALWYGGLYGPFFLTTIEILDGYSEQWGASCGDLLANTLGSALFIGQELAWEDQRIQLKYSFYPTEYPQANPNILGENLIQQSVKDYNGQTYWLSTNINSFIENDVIPDFLNLAVGYGIDNLTSGKNYTENSNKQYYLSLDIDLTKIKTKSKFLDKSLKLLSFIKLPFPAIMINSHKKLTFYPIYYGQ